MIIKTILAPLIAVRCVAKLSFLAGATAGAAGVVALCALRRATEARREEKPVTSA